MKIALIIIVIACVVYYFYNNANNQKNAVINHEQGSAFLAENAQKEGVKTTASGLQYLVLQQGNGDQGLFDAQFGAPSSIYMGIIECGLPINAGPHTYVLRSAIHSLDQWVRTGTPPASMPRLENNADLTICRILTRGRVTLRPALRSSLFSTMVSFLAMLLRSFS